ncbi:BZ3500_MvSof-1268-A1-R1_Chr2-1g04281 [Microbotryum saponariae]|uniref:BZ3500_MvSof-1268-A1-R1_Chr2-1g04281 protein n=1 Tax=Microbotryum saponariae TaxID=289078 RepID=A0A2X0K5Y5_9BASI|nr:BZ3500_MvSof-1268-A1-R1_Chr2-1g04281 [Microbotryum saponariae]SCZ91311.1 BZ3501_MvSof-1269-A2-R1_Chr2-1g03937 [Microbotryum saponariae]
MVSIPKAPAAAVAASTVRSSCAEWDTAAPAQQYSLSNVPKYHFELGPSPLENGPRFIGEHSRSSSWQSCSTGVALSRRRESDPPSSAVTDIQELSASAPELPPVEPTPFISKLSHILELSEHREYISIILASHHPNLLKALSQYFKYTTITSLIRQLNIYSFKRLTTTQLLDVLDLTRSTKLSASDYCGFAHPKFFRPTLGRRCSLGDFKPLSKQRSRKSTRRHSAGNEPNLGTMRHTVLSRDRSSIGYFGDLGMH